MYTRLQNYICCVISHTKQRVCKIKTTHDAYKYSGITDTFVSNVKPFTLGIFYTSTTDKYQVLDLGKTSELETMRPAIRPLSRFSQILRPISMTAFTTVGKPQ